MFKMFSIGRSGRLNVHGGNSGEGGRAKSEAGRGKLILIFQTFTLSQLQTFIFYQTLKLSLFHNLKLSHYPKARMKLEEITSSDYPSLLSDFEGKQLNGH